MLKLDNRDIEILGIIQKEGRITKYELAKRIHLSTTPCWLRIKRLEQEGIILGYGAHLSLKNLGSHTITFVSIELSSHTNLDFEYFENRITELDCILECWAIGGGIDYLLKVISKDIDQYQQIIDQLLNDTPLIKRYYSYIVTKPVKSNPLISKNILNKILD